ncbi:MAG: SMI1/KNR4 family protein [Myxococcota bacterium]
MAWRELPARIGRGWQITRAPSEMPGPGYFEGAADVKVCFERNALGQVRCERQRTGTSILNVISKIEHAVGKQLPTWYTTLVQSTWNGVQEEYRSKEGTEFYFLRIASEDNWNALESIQNLGAATVEAWRILELYAQRMRSSGEATLSVGGRKKKPVSWLSERITVGDSNGNPVFLDQDDFSLWVFYHDGWDAERIATSFEELVYIGDE